MKITSIIEKPIEKFPFWIVPQGGERDIDGKRKVEQVNLEIKKGYIEFLPPEIDALIVTSDLQGIIIENEKEYLLGEKLPAFLELLIMMDFPMLNKAKIQVMLCGDLFAMLNKRGGLGEVKNVWRKFKDKFGNVIGVAGNHDDFGTYEEFECFKREEGINFIQKEIKKIQHIEVGGISGIIGQINKPNRIEESVYLATLKKLLLKQPNVILLHESPDFPDKSFAGNTKIRELIENSPNNMIFCGHCHWNEPLIELKNGSQVMNVDNRVVILINSKFGQV